MIPAMPRARESEKGEAVGTKRTNNSKNSNLFKGITSRVCQLLFVNATFKVGPSSSAQSACASGCPTCLRSGNWSLRPAPHNLHAVIGWGLHTTAQRLMPGNIPSTVKKKKIQAEGKVSADTDTATHF